MNNNAIISLTDESAPFREYSPDNMEIIEAEIDIAGASVRLQISVEDKPARLSDIVPLARAISDKLCQAILNHPAGSGQTVQCQKGCSNCCSYLVPLSMPEVFRLREELSAMGEDFASCVLNTSLACKEKILDIHAFQKLHINDHYEISEISRWYAELRLPCPFLSKGLCSIYRQRPLACREHMVTSPSSLCKSSALNFPETVEMPVSVLEALGQLAAEFEKSEVEAVILPLALAGLEDGPDRSQRTWPAIRLVERFVDIVKTTARKHAAKPQLLV